MTKRISLDETDPRWRYNMPGKEEEKSAILAELERMAKGRRYVDSPDEAPEGVEVQEGPQGGLWYETDSADGATGEENEDVARDVASSIAERVNWDDRDEDIHNRHHKLSISDEQKEVLREGLEEELGEEPVEEFYSAISAWKSDSDKPEAGTHMAALKEVIGAEAEFDEFVIDGEPSDEHIAVARVAHELSKSYWENQIDEDYLHRGITQDAYGRLIDQWFNSDDVEGIELQENPVNSYTTHEPRANHFAEGTGKIRFAPDTEDIGATIDFLFSDAKSEAEVHVGADGKMLSPSDVTMGADGPTLDTPFSEYSKHDHEIMQRTIQDVYLKATDESITLNEQSMSKLVEWAGEAWEVSDGTDTRLAETALHILEIGDKNYGIGPGKPTRDGPEGYDSLEQFEEGERVRIDTDFQGVQEGEVIDLYNGELIVWDDQDHEYVIDDLGDVIEVLS